MIDLSVLDLAPIPEGADAAQALRHTLDLARHADRLGYRRHWLAEHHNLDGLACSATAVLVGHVAAGTRRIRVGSGGVMLPNHAPLVVAEQFGTLATLHPDRIDLGLGRAPGTDGPTMRALRRAQVRGDERGVDAGAEEQFARDVVELLGYLATPSLGAPPAAVRALPGQGTEVPVWLLGSSLTSARLAAHLGLPFAFASHFAPELLMHALSIYRDTYRPSARWPRPHAMVAVNVVAAATDAEAHWHFTSLQQRFLGMRRGQRGPLPRPVENLAALASADELAAVDRMLAVSAVGSPETVAVQLQHLIDATGADELIASSAIHDHAARVASLEILAEIGRRSRSA